MTDKQWEERQVDKSNVTISGVKLRQKHVGQRCPVCNGFGSLKYGTKVCQACSGKGFILIEAEENK